MHKHTSIAAGGDQLLAMFIGSSFIAKDLLTKNKFQLKLATGGHVCWIIGMERRKSLGGSLPESVGVWEWLCV